MSEFERELKALVRETMYSLEAIARKYEVEYFTAVGALAREVHARGGRTSKQAEPQPAGRAAFDKVT